MTTPDDISGLVAWYQATSAYCFSDSGGTTPCNDGDLVYVWNDCKGTNHLTQATLSLRPTYRSSGGCTWVDFDGTRYMDAGSAWASAHPISISSWVYVTTNATRIYASIGISGSTGNNRWLLAESSSKVAATTGFQTNTTANIPLSQWTQSVAVFASATSRVPYVSGGNKGTSSGSSSSPAGVNLARVGASPSASSIFTGRMSEVAVWSASLTDQNVSNLYTSGVPTLAAPLLQYANRLIGSRGLFISKGRKRLLT